MFQKPTIVRAVDGVSFAVQTGETLAIVGESGCGKSTVGRLALRLLEPTSGSVAFEGHDLAALDEAGLRGLRRDMQMVFQDPFSSLNPRMTVADIVGEPLWLHGLGSAKERREKTARPAAHRRACGPEHAERYPHEFSGGQRQRIGIARALASEPRLIIGDEPVSALDVSIQAQVINLLEDLKERFSLTLIIIAHDLAVIRHMSDRVIVMYLGKIVEVAPTAALYDEPLHPYTRALLAAIPLPSPGLRGERKLLEGDIPSPANPPSGCRFHTRCPYAQARCSEEEPAAARRRRAARSRAISTRCCRATMPRAPSPLPTARPSASAWRSTATTGAGRRRTRRRRRSAKRSKPPAYARTGRQFDARSLMKPPGRLTPA